MNAEAQRSLHDRPRNPDAVDLTMRGWALFNQSFTKTNQQHEALALFDQADGSRSNQRRRTCSRCFHRGATSYANGWFDPSADPHAARDAAEPTKPFCSILTKPVAHLTKALLIMQVQNETRRLGVGKRDYFRAQRQRFRADPSLAEMPI